MTRFSIKQAQGFTMLELTMSMALLATIGVLTFTVINSLNAGMALSAAKDQAQACVRDALAAMTAELEQASKKTNTALTPALAALSVPSTSSVQFQVPADNQGSAYSQAILYTFVNEDANANGLLDAGEDSNNDGILTRCVTRTQTGATQRVVGGVNGLSSVQFALNTAGDILTITITASCAVNNRRHDLVSATASSSVYLHN